MSDSYDLIIQQTENWIRSFIIELTICPFAKWPFENNALRLTVINATKEEKLLEALMSEVLLLDQDAAIETSLLIIPFLGKDFFSYLDLVDLAEALLAESGYEGIYQLATFHPDYCFADTPADDVTNYTNRSPYPMLHLLREDSVEKAIEHYGNTEKIPENNIKLMRNLGVVKVEKILQVCMQDNKIR